MTVELVTVAATLVDNSVGSPIKVTINVCGSSLIAFVLSASISF